MASAGLRLKLTLNLSQARPRRTALTTALFGLLPMLALAVPTTVYASAKNVNFDGKWSVTATAGVGYFVISGENVTTGAFGGELIGPKGAPLEIVDGQVTGNSYTLTVETAGTVVDVNGAQFTYGGTITGNTMTITETALHVWHNGHPVSASSTDPGPFTGTREGSDTSTDVACKQQDTPVGTFSCTATVKANDASSDAPSGTVTFSVPKGTFSDPSCDLKADSGSSASCSVDETPTAVANEADETVTATYASDGASGTSDGDTTIDAITASVTSKTVDTYLDGTADATFTFDLSRDSDVPVVLDYATQDGTGADAALAANGDYKPAKGTLTFASGETTKKVIVDCYPEIKLRVPSYFDLVLSNPVGTSFGDTPTSQTGALSSHLEVRDEPHSPTAKSVTVMQKIVPHLGVGQIAAIKNLVTGKTGRLYVIPYGTVQIRNIYEGDWVYVGDKLFLDKNTASAVEFVLGGAAAIQPGEQIRIADERHAVAEPDDPNLYELQQKITIWDNVSHQQETLQIQTNGGMSIKG